MGCFWPDNEPRIHAMIVSISPPFDCGRVVEMKLAINNLVENALKYSPAGSPIEIALLRKDGIVELSVRDEGPGIPDAEKERIFERFYRLGQEKTRQAKGTGLGLYLTRKIVEDHRGRIFVTDNHPAGSNFVIRLSQSNT